MKYTSEQIGDLVRRARKTLGATQKDLAMTSGTGLRFIIDLERGKATCQLGKALTVLNTLGIKIALSAPGGVDSTKNPVNTARHHDTGEGF